MMVFDLESRLKYLDRVNQNLGVSSISPKAEYLITLAYFRDSTQAIERVEKRYQNLIELKCRLIYEGMIQYEQK